MISPAALNNELAYYRALAAQLQLDFTEIDDETLADTLEGLSDLPELLEAVIRSSLEDGAVAEALRGRLEDMKARLERFEDRQKRKRSLVCDAMEKAGLDKLAADDFSVSRRKGGCRINITNEGQIPAAYLMLQAPRVDRSGLLSALKTGQAIPGAELQDGEAFIQVRTR